MVEHRTFNPAIWVQFPMVPLKISQKAFSYDVENIVENKTWRFYVGYKIQQNKTYKYDLVFWTCLFLSH